MGSVEAEMEQERGIPCHVGGDCFSLGSRDASLVVMGWDLACLSWRWDPSCSPRCLVHVGRREETPALQDLTWPEPFGKSHSKC